MNVRDCLLSAELVLSHFHLCSHSGSLLPHNTLSKRLPLVNWKFGMEQQENSIYACVKARCHLVTNYHPHGAALFRCLTHILASNSHPPAFGSPPNIHFLILPSIHISILPSIHFSIPFSTAIHNARYDPEVDA